MPEILTLTAPETKPSNTGYLIAQINENWLSGTIEILFVGATGESKVAFYGPLGLYHPVTGLIVPGSPTGATLLKAQNKMNFSVNSRQKRIFQQAITDGVFAGTITGTPD